MTITRQVPLRHIVRHVIRCCSLRNIEWEESGYLRVEFRTRLGYSDLGKNRSRMEEIRNRFA